LPLVAKASSQSLQISMAMVRMTFSLEMAVVIFLENQSLC